MKKYGKQARMHFSDGYNCAQAVMLTFCDDLALDTAFAARLTNCLGGGFSQTGGMCGAVSAACLVMSAKHGREDASRKGDSLLRQQATYAMVQKLQADFAQKYGSVLCPTLLETALSASGGQSEKHRCPAYLAFAAELCHTALCEAGQG